MCEGVYERIGGCLGKHRTVDCADRDLCSDGDLRVLSGRDSLCGVDEGNGHWQDCPKIQRCCP